MLLELNCSTMMLFYQKKLRQVPADDISKAVTSSFQKIFCRLLRSNLCQDLLFLIENYDVSFKVFKIYLWVCLELNMAALVHISD